VRDCWSRGGKEPVDPKVDLWRRLVNSVSYQEDYVKSLERRVESIDIPAHRTFVEGLLDSARERLVLLRSQLKAIDEGEDNG
jgi:hypothetical protein